MEPTVEHRGVGRLAAVTGAWFAWVLAIIWVVLVFFFWVGEWVPSKTIWMVFPVAASCGLLLLGTACGARLVRRVTGRPLPLASGAGVILAIWAPATAILVPLAASHGLPVDAFITLLVLASAAASMVAGLILEPVWRRAGLHA